MTNQDDEDTDTKLALLASLLEPITIPFEKLLESLNDNNGNVSKAAEELLMPTPKKIGKRQAGNDLQSWFKKSKDSKIVKKEIIAVNEQDDSKICEMDAEVKLEENLGSFKGEPSKTSNNVNLLSILRGRSTSNTIQTKAGPQPALLLTSQALIDSNSLPITLLESPLPPSLASALYLELLEESEKSWYNNEFYLAGKAVKSPHTVQMYKHPESKAWKKGIKYWYSGTSMIDIADYPPLLRKAADLVEKAVNESLNKRKRYPLEWAGEWKANCCGTNRYDGAKSSVGWHADQLTYLGPYTTIASLSLGTPRAFRLRQTNTVDPNYATNTKPIRTYELNLGHNSLCLMNAGCQERYKHTVPPQKALDLFRPTFDLDENPIPLYNQKAYTSRINITFRFYRDDFHPDPSIGPFGPREGTPLCKCGIPTLLRADQKAKARSRILPISPTKSSSAKNKETTQDDNIIEDDMMYFWQCQSPSQTGDMKGCGFFKILDMKKEGRGPCLGDIR
ncbi:uncharacterized protein L201_002623 [Kwoniella dendrophila CBS 6074]|uniref:Fe2OG dioxygenase domain-containing protein n=1 Tax=Kwoniella dendrophila CBS 6074 TaxID=1295534 RepID=A0AAX4JQQ4_9TREE